MPVKVNPLLLHDLFYTVMNDLENAQNLAYNDDLSRIMKHECEKKRREYVKQFNKILNHGEWENE